MMSTNSRHSSETLFLKISWTYHGEWLRLIYISKIQERLFAQVIWMWIECNLCFWSSSCYLATAVHLLIRRFSKKYVNLWYSCCCIIFKWFIMLHFLVLAYRSYHGCSVKEKHTDIKKSENYIYYYNCFFLLTFRVEVHRVFLSLYLIIRYI